MIGSVYYVNRPFVYNKVNLLFPHVEDASFPSDHATGIILTILSISKLGFDEAIDENTLK